MSIQDLSTAGIINDAERLEFAGSTDFSGRAELLRGLCGGALQLPGDAGYDEARMPWNVAVDQRPAAVAYPASAIETAQVVRAAIASGLRVAPQSTGHNAGPLGPLDDVVIVRTSAMTHVDIDPVLHRARVGGGTLWLPVVEAAAQHGFATLHGSSPDVGVAGYSLGGGMGWYARKLGLQTNSIRALEMVTPDGNIIQANADENPEIFWAARGGSGNFGIVTAMEFDIFPIESAFGGMLVWDRTELERVLRRWVDWADQAPDEVTTSFRVLNLPPLPELPAAFRGRQLVVIDGAVLASDERSAEIIAALRELNPEIDTFSRVPAASLVRLHMDPEGPTPGVSNSVLIDGMPEAAIDAFLESAGPDSRSSLLAHELRQLGGALGRPHPGAGALPMVDGQFLAFGVGIAATPEMGAAGQRDADIFAAAMSPFGSGRQYLNFVEHAIDASAGYDPVTWGRLVTLKSALDPNGIMVGNHRVRRAFEPGD
jgi:FAD/FMN-containing dehydrogenase